MANKKVIFILADGTKMLAWYYKLRVKRLPKSERGYYRIKKIIFEKGE